MQQIYYDSQKETITAGHSLKVYSKRLPTGYIFDIHVCFACSYEREANDLIKILVDDGAEEHTVRSYKPALIQTGLSILNGGPIGGNDRAVAHFPDADVGDVIEIHLLGVIMPIEEWREGKYG
jgi:hypothetical protein